MGKEFLEVKAFDIFNLIKRVYFVKNQDDECGMHVLGKIGLLLLLLPMVVAAAALVVGAVVALLSKTSHLRCDTRKRMNEPTNERTNEQISEAHTRMAREK